MTRPFHVWLAFAACLAVVLAALAWISFTALRLDRAERLARQQAALEESIRSALWRMDSALAPVIAAESVRPVYAFAAFYPAEQAYTAALTQVEPGQLLLPSPLLTAASPFVQLHFQIEPGAQISSPRAPSEPLRTLALQGYLTAADIAAAEQRIDALTALLGGSGLAARLPLEDPPPVRAAVLPEPEIAGARGAQMPPQQAAEGPEQTAQVQQFRNQSEFAARQRSYQLANRPDGADAARGNVLLSDSLVIGPLRPLWLGGELLLARRMRIDESEFVQGCWLDWPALRAWLLGEAADLLPGAALEPLAETAADPRERQLAGVPARLVVAPAPALAVGGLSPVQGSLLVAWIGTLGAALAVALLLRGTLALSERRAAFVSAVTHELRTPLTTFRVYAEMLADNMVPDAEKRVRYLETLRVESVRLAHLVENVLSFARLERGRHLARAAPVRVGALIDRVHDRLAERAAQAGLRLELHLRPGVDDVLVRTDAGAVEQILFNLVDNACKYAAPAAAQRGKAGGAPVPGASSETATAAAAVLELSACAAAGRRGPVVELRIRDQGPGIAAADARRIFQPFHKSAREAAHSAPGVGLGLALSRRLARELGGDLSLEAVPTGACFVLRLPAV